MKKDLALQVAEKKRLKERELREEKEYMER